MKKSDLIKRLEKDIQENGDLELLSYKVVDSRAGSEWFRTVKTDDGKYKKMTIKQFQKSLEVVSEQ